jgi:hypothetical protein
MDHYIQDKKYDEVECVNLDMDDFLLIFLEYVV